MTEYNNKPYVTPEGWRRALDEERHHRENGWDYRRRGVYHITMTVAERYPLFGKLEGATPEAAKVELNKFGWDVLDLLRNTPQFYGPKGYSIKILAAQVMPDHIHVVIHVLEPLPRSIGEVIRGFKSACTSLYKREWSNNGIEQFSRIFARTGSIWEKKKEYYHERILHGEGQLRAMIDYVHDNPRRLAMKKANPDLFKIQTNLQRSGISMRILGNRFWLDYPNKTALHCSRTLSQEEIASKRDECLVQAQNGTVYICAAISEGEKQVCRALREEGYPLVVFLADGFPKEDSVHYKYYKPTGVYFEACAKGQLLLIELGADFYERPDVIEKVTAKVGDIPHDTKRWRFVAANYAAEILAGEVLAKMREK